jgi:hypothetical protein
MNHAHVWEVLGIDVVVDIAPVGEVDLVRGEVGKGRGGGLGEGRRVGGGEGRRVGGGERGGVRQGRGGEGGEVRGRRGVRGERREARCSMGERRTAPPATPPQYRLSLLPNLRLGAVEI